MRESDIQRNKKKFKKCARVTGKAVFPLELCDLYFPLVSSIVLFVLNRE